MFLEEPCVSLCIMLKHSGLSGCPVELLCWKIGEGALRCSLILSASPLPDSPTYTSEQLMWGHLKWQMTPLLCSIGSLSLSVTSNVLRVLVPLKCTCMPLDLQTFKPFSCSLNVWDHNCNVPVVAVGGVVVCMSGIIVVMGVLIGLVIPFKSLLKLVKCPIRKLTCL